ncbi:MULTISPECIES: response regulator [unclassified Variovorax]|uniref:hybrid sensor histidine kinase/response regulator n=1 Tax=unclassified Variovorax TaxID=663243 RepID=UPI00076BFDDA|nr:MULTISPECIES: response regulator [unclassified Variovorax]KWT72177.1 Chemotaxis protein methyltransferase CheR [Variovorax sp. WDL1]PNG58883.1 Aerobic respiration control sensor protein ArcB [Variovorax sp. B4]PNG61327.1 Aerobic respiration control sensor protein ArcB [Variovorax sp. B2]VTV12679.1 Aerobic respiration control sensor protein ArcB [Variovorax sp. WDL1]
MIESVINTSIDRSRHRVAVVDDNPATRYATARVIRAAGFQTVEASTGQEAIELSRQHVSAIVLDVHLPDLNGFEVCRAIRADRATHTLPVIHLSAAFIRNEDKVAGLNAGADAYLVHPVEPPVLIATLQALIRARLAEELLRRSETRFRAIYNQAPTGMALIDSAGNFVDVNPALERMLQRPAASLHGKPVSSIAPEEWAAFAQEKAVGEARDGVTWQGEFPLLRPDGSAVRLEWTLANEIEPGISLGIAIDVSGRLELERRQAELLEREQAARLVAERHSRTKDDFIAVLSHELRNPLNAIAGWVHLLRTRTGTPELLHKGLEAIDRSVKAQALLIADILDVSRVSSGKLRLRREWIDPRALVNGSIDALATSAAAKGLEIRFDAQGAVEPAWLDPTRFQQIVWNLLSNAIKFSNRGSWIQVTLLRDGDRLTLKVQDFGRGIEKEFLGRLFDRFSQSDSPDNRLHGGLGLGLSIVKNLAELHGGVVTAASRGLGEGATLTVELIAVPPADADDLDKRVESSASDQDGRLLDGLEVLVVEDNVDASEILSVVLTDAGARVRVAADYVSALQLSDQKWPDILVSDIGLPGRDGYDLIRQLRHLGESNAQPKFFAVALTAFSRPQDLERSIEAGFDAHLAKPLQPHALMTLLRARAG